MFIRTKEISGRRYVYLVEGMRYRGKVRQKTLSYLGPLSALAFGIPDAMKKRVESNVRRKLDWRKILEQMNAIPLNVDELLEMKRKRYTFAIRARNFKLEPKKYVVATPKVILAQRSKGELLALAKLSVLAFERSFESLGNRKYRMRL